MITPYLVFNGGCKDAMDFYRAVFPCGEPNIMNYGDYMPEGSQTPLELLRTWVMHGEMNICGTNIWFADEAAPVNKADNIKLAVTVSTGKEAADIFNALCQDGQMTLPPTETFTACSMPPSLTNLAYIGTLSPRNTVRRRKEKNNMQNERLYKMKFSGIYPMYVQKAEKKGRVKEELDAVIFWLTGYDEHGLQAQIEKEASLESFFAEAPQINPNVDKIKGVICGVRVEEINDPLMQKIRWLDKLVDELAKGKAMAKILR